MFTLHQHTVGQVPAQQRLVDYCLGLFPGLATRNSVKKALKRGELLLNAQEAEQSRWVQTGDCIELVDKEWRTPPAFDLELPIAYEDEHLAAVVKPAGIVVSGNQFRTLANALPACISPSPLPDALRWPRPVHRLDGPTSGLVLVAKTQLSLVALGQLLEQRKVHKTYHAIVKGLPPVQGEIHQPIDGLEAHTSYSLLQQVPSLRNGYLSLLSLHPHTGRTHQLRIHLAQLGHPILGDKLHDQADETLGHKGLFLAAVGLDLVHPATGHELQIRAPRPAKFDALLARELRRWQKYHPL